MATLTLKPCKSCLHYTRGWCSLLDIEVRPDSYCRSHRTLRCLVEEGEP